MATIKFRIPGRMNTRVIIYDMMGKELLTLVDESLKCGNYKIEVNDPELPRGEYFYKVVAEGFTVTRKILKNK